MSLIQRVTSIDGIDREARHGSVKSVRRVISYDAFPPQQESSQATNPTGGMTAYKVSTLKRFVQVLVTVLACWLASGIVFGFAALKPVLIDQGVYRDLCTEEELLNDVEVCYEQDLRLNLFFAIASTTSNVSALPVGTILDRYGPRVSNVLGCLCLIVGSTLMGYAFAMPEFDGYILGNIFLALGGTFIFVPSFQIANAFPMYSGTIVATVTGAFDASAAVFLLYRIAYQASNGTYIPERFFFGYLAVPILILIAQFTIMEHDSYKTLPQLEEKLHKNMDVLQDVHDSDEDVSDNEVRRLRAQRREHRESNLRELDKLLGDSVERQERKEEASHTASGVWGALHGKTALEQVRSPWFILITLLTVLQMLRMNYFIATIRAQYEYMLNSRRLAVDINTFFDIALPIGGVLATPPIGLLLDSVSTATLLAIIVATITVIGIVGSLPFFWAGIVNVILFVLLRPLYYSAMSDYAAKVFGFATFGRVYGTIICFSGLVNLSQPAIDAATHDLFMDNPIPFNAILASLGFLFGSILVAFVYWQGSHMQKLQAKEDPDPERAPLDFIEESESEYGTF